MLAWSGRTGYSTVFPQSITVAASFNKDLMKEIGTVIFDEVRAKHHEFLRQFIVIFPIRYFCIVIPSSE